MSADCRACLTRAVHAGQHLSMARPQDAIERLLKLRIIKKWNPANASDGAEPSAPEATKK